MLISLPPTTFTPTLLSVLCGTPNRNRLSHPFHLIHFISSILSHSFYHLYFISSISHYLCVGPIGSSKGGRASRELFLWFHDIARHRASDEAAGGERPRDGRGQGGYRDGDGPWVSLGSMGIQQLALDSIGGKYCRYFLMMCC